jgi:7-keto-8-aminopelargonate synthetase-like enzyme
MTQNHQQITLKNCKHKTALGDAINQSLNKKELVRMRKFADFCGDIHLKDTITTAVNQRKSVINGQEVVNFGSANYLGLEQHKEVIQAANQGAIKYGTHAGCSRVFSQHENIVTLENEIASLIGSESVLMFANVSQTHQGVLPTLFGQRNTDLFLDRFAHKSMFASSMIAKGMGAKLRSFDSEKLDQLEKKLSLSTAQTKVVMIDGVYSMQGTIPDFEKIDQICKKHSAILYVDDAHGIGIYGKNGGGVLSETNVGYENVIYVGSLQKGFASFGGFVGGSKAMIDLLKVSSSSYIFSGALQPSAVEGGLKAIEISRSEEGNKLRTQLKNNSTELRQRIKKLGFEVGEGDSPIIPVAIGDDLSTLLAGKMLFDHGAFVNSVMYPAVPKDKGIIRISVSSNHSALDIDCLVSGFAYLANHLKKDQSKVSKGLMLGKEIIKSRVQKIFGT